MAYLARNFGSGRESDTLRLILVQDFEMGSRPLHRGIIMEMWNT